ncbi:MAG: sulfotransferase domain-containing protein [Deltaproteobacteria bacterium]|nr:sulfotransferase domain-containing protein [Deltaproteobacteria bacterium]
MNGIIWIASYPKSGNTWFRLFLTNLLLDPPEPADINDITTTIASSRGLFDDYAGIESSDLLPEEIERKRPQVYELLAEEAEDQVFIKIHDAYTYLEEGLPLVSTAGTWGVVYIVRNPLDIAASYAHHNQLDLDKAITDLANESNFLGKMKHGLSDQIVQRILSWSSHVKSWVDAPGLNICLIRYEDMLDHPEKTFGRAARFCGLPDDPERLSRAIRFSSFEVVKEQERGRKFKETPPGVSTFFRRGKTGAWREELNPKQVRRIVSEHGDVMQRFGYLPEGEIV